MISLSSIIFSSWLTLFTSTAIVESAPIVIGSFRTRQHQLQGTVTLLSESVIEITVRTVQSLQSITFYSTKHKNSKFTSKNHYQNNSLITTSIKGIHL
jgi:hypothetical protein